MSRNLSISSKLSNLLACNYYSFHMVFGISVVLVIISPLSLLILFSWVIFVFFLFTLSKNKLLVY